MPTDPPVATRVPAGAVASRLDRGAPLARALAAELCRTESGHDDCGALHGIWPELRRLGLAADPARHGDFYARELGERAARGDSPRVLVAGCADWGMLEVAAAAYLSHGARLDVTVVDRCPTPVLLCAWFGAEIALPVRTGVAELSGYRDADRFDLICSHSLLTYPPLEARRRLVANWHALLRPGGAVVTVSRLSTETHQRNPQRAHQFGELVFQRAGELGRIGDGAELRARAERFALAQVAHPVGTAADLRALFEHQGFEVARLDVRRIDGALTSSQPVVGAARGGSYGEIVAVKR